MKEESLHKIEGSNFVIKYSKPDKLYKVWAHSDKNFPDHLFKFAYNNTDIVPCIDWLIEDYNKLTLEDSLRLTKLKNEIIKTTSN